MSENEQEVSTPLAEKLVPLTHTNVMDDRTGKNATIYIVREKFFAWYRSGAHKCTHLMADAGGMVPVVETPEQVCGAFIGPDTTISNEKETEDGKE